MEVVLLSIGSVTQATRAARVLSAGSVRAKTQKISSGIHEKGCIWGVQFERRHLYTAMQLLAHAGIAYEIH